VADALLTDHYELTMVDAALRDGSAMRTAVFQTFCRQLPSGRRYGVAAGLGRLLPMLVDLRFSAADLDHLAATRVVSDDTLSWLESYRFSGDVVAYPEGELLLPDSPVLTVEASFAEAVVLETLVLSVLNHDAAVAAAASRMALAARGRTLLEFGSRRTHEQAAVAAARAAWLVGFDASSNLRAGARHGVPTSGTAAHAFTLLHESEQEAFAAQVRAAGPGTTLLVDTYDVEQGIRNAVAAAGTGLGAVRIDSGDLDVEAKRARTLLDELGATDTRIVVSGDLEEHAIDALADAPVDGYGVGTQLVTGSGAPTANLVYKMVARSDRAGGPADVPVSKDSGEKSTHPGRLRATRELDEHGTAVAEVLTPWGAPAPEGRPLQVQVVRAGELVHADTREQVLARHRAALAELPDAGRDLGPGDPAIPTLHR